MTTMTSRTARPVSPPVAAGRMVRVAGALAVPILAVTGILIASPLVACTVPIVIGLVVVEAERRRRTRAEMARADALPLFVDHLLQRLGAGASLGSACRSFTGVGPGVDGRVAVLDPLLDGLARGSTVVEASRALGHQPDPSVRLLATTLRLLATNGGPAVPALRRLRHTLIGRAHRHRRAQAQAASALSSAGLLVLAPTGFALVLAGTEPALARFYLHRPLGAICATVSVLLSWLGWWWIQRLSDRFRTADR